MGKKEKRGRKEEWTSRKDKEEEQPREKKEQGREEGKKEGIPKEGEEKEIMEKIRKILRDSKNEAYTSIAKIRATIPGAVDEKLYERLQMAVTLRE